MNRNVESHFSELPKVEIERSMFDRSSSHKTSFNVGQLIPFYVDEVMPGDTFNITTSCVVRLQTPLTPIMDNMYMDTYYFFVPNRIIWNHWKEFMGENTESAWLPETEYSIPLLYPPVGGWQVGTVADYLGIPTNVPWNDSGRNRNSPSALPFRAYAMIADQWFRDQNLMDPVNIPLGDTNIQGNNGQSYVTDMVRGGFPFPVCKYHDYFTSCLPAPQKGPAIGLFPTSRDQAVGGLDEWQQGFSKYAPVFSREQKVNYDAYHYAYPLSLGSISSGAVTSSYPMKVVSGLSGNPNLNRSASSTTTNLTEVTADNLWADMSQMGITVNELRVAFQLQKFYEKNARAGTRYREIIKEHFGVTTSDARMMIPEYLGGHRFPLSIHQVANQGQSGENDFLGDLGAMSNTSDIHDDFVRSFEEHGFVIGVCCVRYDHSYPQGLERFWLRRNKVDFYFPVFANIGEQAVLKDEIYWQQMDGSEIASPVFGYQEAWAEYRYKPSRVSGEMRPNASNSLASWHLADNYLVAPNLSAGWIQESKSNVDRVLSVTSAVANQVFADFFVKNIATRPMPVYSVPGLIDHH